MTSTPEPDGAPRGGSEWHEPQRWWSSVGDAGCEPPEALRALCEAGVRLRPGDAADGPGLLWVAAADDDALARVRELAGDGRARVLAVAASRDVLEGGAVWRLVGAGASDVLAWDGGAETERAIAARLRRWGDVDALLAHPMVRDRLVGRSPAWIATLRGIVEMAAFTDAAVLLAGESGVGKEDAARLVHALDPRPDRRELVVVDCTTIVPELSGSEFFGHERGAFTGATAPREGAFALADGGTLFLDEVGELAPALQAQLLRVIQEGAYKRVGANVWQRTAFRLVCATNRDLLAEVEQGRFRRDLYHRIAAWSCRLPSLRERSEDVLPLALHFLRELLPPGVSPELDPAVGAFLLRRSYPGNVRDLRQLVFRMGKRHVGPGPITVGDIPPEELPCTEEVGSWPDAGFQEAVRRAVLLGVGLKEIGRAATEAAIRTVLRDEGGNLQRAARRLGVTDRALQIRARREGGGRATAHGARPRR